MIRSVLLGSVLVVAATTFLVFSGTLGHQFVNWDDNVYVYANPVIQPLTLQRSAWILSHLYYDAYIPVTILSHALDVALWGLSPRGHHMTNVLLHMANTVWVLLLGVWIYRRERSKLGRPGEVAIIAGASIAALLFGIHPLRSESVSWVSDRKDLLCAFFILPALLAYMKHLSSEGRNRKRWYWLSFLLYLLAVLSKAIAVVFPAILLLLDRLLLNPPSRGIALVRPKTPFLAVSATISVITYTMTFDTHRAYAVTGLTGLESILFPFYSLSFSLYKTLLPLDLGPIYPRVSVVWMIAGLAFVGAITVVAWREARGGRRGILLAWLTYLLFVIPTVLGLSSGMQPVADRYSYLSTIGMYLLLGFAISSALNRGGATRRAIVAVCCGVLIVVLGTMAAARASLWKSSRSLWGNVVATSPAKPDYTAAYVNLASTYADERHLDEARRILEQAVTIDSSSMAAWYNLGIYSYWEGDRRRAIECFRKATELDPSYAKAFFNLATVYEQLGEGEQSTRALIEAARLGYQEAQEELTSRRIHW